MNLVLDYLDTQKNIATFCVSDEEGFGILELGVKFGKVFETRDTFDHAFGTHTEYGWDVDFSTFEVEVYYNDVGEFELDEDNMADMIRKEIDRNLHCYF